MSTIKDLKGTYVLDPMHTTIGFVVRHAMVTKVRGSFTDFEGQAYVDGQNPSESTMDVTVQIASVNTGQADRDGHLKTGDFFEADKYPTMTFKGTDFQIVDDETVEVTGDLTIKDVTKSVTVPFTFNGEAKDPMGNVRVGFEGTTSLSRKDFGLTYNAALETGGVLISDKVVIELEVSAVKQA